MSTDTERRRVPQLDDTVLIEIRFAPQTEEWAEELLADYDVERTDDALIVRDTVRGNCSGLSNLRMTLDEIESALDDGGIFPMEFTVTVTAQEATA